MDGKGGVPQPGVLNDGRLADVADLLDDVEFAKPVHLPSRIVVRVQAGGVFLADVLDVAEPVVTQADPILREGDPNAAASVVADDHDVLHFEDIDGKLDDGKAVEIGVNDEVGDVPVDEEFSREEVDDFVRGDAAVGTADPEVLGGQLLGESREKGGVLR